MDPTRHPCVTAGARGGTAGYYWVERRNELQSGYTLPALGLTKKKRKRCRGKPVRAIRGSRRVKEAIIFGIKLSHGCSTGNVLQRLLHKQK